MQVDTDKKGSRSHRGQFDIIADILNASSVSVRKTHLMYRCNLSFRQLKQYLTFLLKKGLLNIVAEDGNSNPGLFEVTDKGREFLESYEGLKNLMT